MEATASESPAVNVPVLRRISGGAVSDMLGREWLVTNGLGGYASGTIAGAATRRYHGLLIAAHPAPLGRIMLLNHLGESLRFPDGSQADLGGVEKAGGELDIRGTNLLDEFRLEMGLPVWRYKVLGRIIEKRVYFTHRQNTVHINYRLVGGDGPVRLKLRVSVHFRGHDEPVSTPDPGPYTLTAQKERYEIVGSQVGFPHLRLRLQGISPALTVEDVTVPNVLYRIEQGRGYDNVGTVWSPGLFRVLLTPEQEVTLTASTEAWERVEAITPQQAWNAELERRQRLIAASDPVLQTGIGVELTLAADQFVIVPAGRVQDSAHTQATGEEARTIIAGYHWFTDWGRDTMISLEGLTLATGRHAEARYILRTFAAHMQDGLIPNFFPDHSGDARYHTADATLWFFHAIHRYATLTNDQELVRELLPQLKESIACHQQGTRFGIHVDPDDGLLTQGEKGYQLTWMDAKVGDWVVTPRRGKAVEINALWYNALRILEHYLKQNDDPVANEIAQAADRAAVSFNRRFWHPEENGLYDVVDGEAGNDASCRPNQIFAISLDFPVLDRSKWKPVLDTVTERLMTPMGLRTLAPGHQDYKPKYSGDLRSRDAAYHQGTVWGWLIGPYIDAWHRVYPDRKDECRPFLTALDAHLGEACVGTISEIFDAEAPFTPRGCVAQAWSVAEALRSLVKVDGIKPAS